jgi:hypothetical protein
MFPNLFQFPKEAFIVLDVSELIGILVVSLEIPVRRRRNNEMDRFVTYK